MVRKPFVSLTIIALLLICVLPINSFAYLSNIQILEKKDYAKLSDDALSAAYLDVIIEIDAIYASHVVQVFSPKEYQQYKDLLRYKYELRTELVRRQIEVPNIKD